MTGVYWEAFGTKYWSPKLEFTEKGATMKFTSPSSILEWYTQRCQRRPSSGGVLERVPLPGSASNNASHVQTAGWSWWTVPWRPITCDYMAWSWRWNRTNYQSIRRNTYRLYMRSDYQLPCNHASALFQGVLGRPTVGVVCATTSSESTGGYHPYRIRAPGSVSVLWMMQLTSAPMDTK